MTQTIQEIADHLLQGFDIVKDVPPAEDPEICTDIDPELIRRSTGCLFGMAKQNGYETVPESAWLSAAELLAKYASWKLQPKTGKRYPKPSVGICFYGPCGSGKTVLASTLVKAIRNVAKSTFVISRTQSITEDFHENDHKMRTYIDSEDILIDDLGCERDAKSFGQTWGMSDFLKARYDSAFTKYGYLTIITTNISNPDDLAARYGKPVMSRLFDMVDFVYVNSPDWRYLNRKNPNRW